MLYISGEESQAQVRMRASRIGAVEPNLLLAATTDLSTALGLIEQCKPALAIVDSAQTIVSQEVDGISGGSTQVREVASALIEQRKNLWVTTKLRDSEQGYDSARKAFDRQLGLLQLDYVDMYMLHWPTPFDWRSSETWKAFQEFRAEGRVRTLGVCNFLPEHLDRLHEETGEYPAVNQIELHPTWQQREVVDYCKAHGIAVEAYSPMARGADLNAGNGAIERIAAEHGVTPAQVILRWHIENGTIDQAGADPYRRGKRYCQWNTVEHAVEDAGCGR